MSQASPYLMISPLPFQILPLLSRTGKKGSKRRAWPVVNLLCNFCTVFLLPSHIECAKILEPLCANLLRCTGLRRVCAHYKQFM